MRIGLDLRMADGGSGIGRYITELSHEILKEDKTNQYVLFFRSGEKSLEYKHYNHKIVITGIRHYSFAEQFRFPLILKREKLDLVHFPHFNVPIFYRKPYVVTIHDLTHTLFPGKKMAYFFHRVAYHLVFNSAILKSKKIIAVSQSTKNQILDRFSIPSDKIAVVYEGFDSNYKMMDKDVAQVAVSNRFGISKPYILYVGVWRRYKNLPALAKAFDQLVDRGLDVELVLAGDKDPYYPEIEAEVMNIKHKDRIKALGRVTDEELNILYNATMLFVLPSKMEGFGLTALEASATGTPIAASDIPTLREILGQGAEYFDPENLQNMVDIMFALLQKPERLEELSNLALKRASLFSWKKAAEETISLYKNT